MFCFALLIRMTFELPSHHVCVKLTACESKCISQTDCKVKTFFAPNKSSSLIFVFWSSLSSRHMSIHPHAHARFRNFHGGSRLNTHLGLSTVCVAIQPCGCRQLYGSALMLGIRLNVSNSKNCRASNDFPPPPRFGSGTRNMYSPTESWTSLTQMHRNRLTCYLSSSIRNWTIMQNYVALHEQSW